MNYNNENDAHGEKYVNDGSPHKSGSFSPDPEDQGQVVTGQNHLHRDLKGRHMQMIAM